MKQLLLITLLLVASLTSTQAQTISFSGTIYDTGTESLTAGTATNLLDNKPLYVNFSRVIAYDGNYGGAIQVAQIIASVPANVDGTYSFANVPNVPFCQISLAIEMGVVGNNTPTSRLPNAINAGAKDAHYQSDYGLNYIYFNGVPNGAKIDFHFNQLPRGSAITAPEQPNPDDGTTPVPVPTITGSDPEDGIYDGISGTTTIAITSIYPNPILVYKGQVLGTYTFIQNYPPHYLIENYDPSQLKVIPPKGATTVSFDYYILDAAKRWSSSPATVTIPLSSTIAFYDYGDLAATLENATNPAAHRFVNGLRMGQLIDYETGPLSSTSATGDDSDNLDDEDGLNYGPALSTASTSYSVTVSVFNNLGQDATLSAWIDFNNNSVFEPTERAQATVSSSVANKNVTLTWPNLTTVAIGTIGARFRLATNANEVETPYGRANSGEVEDYILTVRSCVSGRILVDKNGMNDNAVNGTPWQNQYPLHLRVLSLFWGGSTESVLANVAPDGTFSFDMPPNTTWNLVLADGNDYPGNVYSFLPTSTPKLVRLTGGLVGSGSGNGLVAYNNGYYLPITMGSTTITDVTFGVDQYPTANAMTAASQTNPLGNARMQVPTLTGSDPEDGLYDGISGTNTIRISLYSVDYQTYPYYGDYGFGPAYSTLYYDGVPVTHQQIIANYDPAKLTVDPKEGNVTARFLYRPIDAAGIEGLNYAEVTIPFSDTVTQLDFGDASNIYRTGLDYSNGPRHIIVDGLRLGTLVDAEADGQPNDSATGDNLADQNDEDGVTSFAPLNGSLTPFSLSVAVTNTIGADATLSGWIDFDRNGVLENDERAQVTVPSGATAVILSWSVRSLTVAQTYARFRIASNASEVAEPVGQANSGEVEDYQFTVAAPLPVALTRFEGHWLEGAGNQLTWTTAWEHDNNYFQIQTSRDAKSFETIGQTAGHATTSVPQAYSFIDPQPLAELTYYRLRQVDLSGAFTYSSIIAIRTGDETDHQPLLVYPNPTTELLQLGLSKQATMTSATVYTASGHRVLHVGNASASIDVKLLPSGVYLLEVRTTSGQVLSQRFIKQ